MARDKIIERIRKLLALAGNNPNEAEAALAMEKAQAELALHNLSLSEIDVKERDDITQMSGPTTPAHPHLRQLALAVARLYFAEYFYMRIRGAWKTQHVFVGSASNVQVALLMFEYLSSTIDRLAFAGARVNGGSKAYVTSFRVACTNRLAKRIHDRIEEAKKGGVKTSSGTTLPALLDLYASTQKRLQAFLQDEVGVKETKTRKSKINNIQGMLDGRAAGDTISLDQQIGKQQATGLLT
jgi:hypothetical protein